MNIKKSVAFVIYNNEKDNFLAVKRPSDDDNLPNVRGLPAGSLKGEETREDSVIRAGKEKLGVELQIVGLIGSGKLQREKHILQMNEYEVKIMGGEIKVPQNIEGITQYQTYDWVDYRKLINAAQKGSLCSRIYLNSINKTWD